MRRAVAEVSADQGVHAFWEAQEALAAANAPTAPDDDAFWEAQEALAAATTVGHAAARLVALGALEAPVAFSPRNMPFLRAFYDTAYAGAYDIAALVDTGHVPWWRSYNPRMLEVLDAFAACLGRASFEDFVASIPAYPPPGFAA
jgi:hypothetical protein